VKKHLIKILAMLMLVMFAIVNVYAVTISTSQTGTDGLWYSFWTNGGGSVSMGLNGGGSYSVNWTNCGDFTCGKGWSTGTGRTVTYSGSCTWNGGGGALGLYGWSTNPLVEYYIMDAWGGSRQTPGTHMGTVTSDGGTYDIYEHQQVNQPSIIGNATFMQYLSIRQSPRIGGTITAQNHFNAWASHGMNLGTMNYQILLTEAWNGSGNSNITVSEGGSSGGGGTNLNSWQCNSHSSDLNIWTGGVGGWNVGDYIEFNNVNLSGHGQMNFNLASASNGSFKIVIDSYSGTQIGTLNYSSTGGWNNYNNQSCNLNSVTGTHNLYIICASGAANIGTLTLQ
jgi:endo-1,4-beta-xylanase